MDIDPNAPQIHTGVAATLNLSLSSNSESEISLTSESWIKVEFPVFLQDCMPVMSITALSDSADWHCTCEPGTTPYLKLAYTGADGIFPANGLTFEIAGVLTAEAPSGKNETVTVNPNHIGGITKPSEALLNLLDAVPQGLDQLLHLSLGNSKVFIPTDGTPYLNTLQLIFLNIRQDNKAFYNGPDFGNGPAEVIVTFDYDNNTGMAPTKLTDETTAKETITSVQVGEGSEWKTEDAKTRADISWLLTPQENNIIGANENVIIEFNSVVPNSVEGTTYMHVEIRNFPKEDGTAYPNYTYALEIEKVKIEPLINLDVISETPNFNWRTPQIDLLLHWDYLGVYEIKITNKFDNSVILTRTYDDLYSFECHDTFSYHLDLQLFKEDDLQHDLYFQVEAYDKDGNIRRVDDCIFKLPPKIQMDFSPNYFNWSDLSSMTNGHIIPDDLQVTIRIAWDNNDPIQFDKTYFILTFVDGNRSFKRPLEESDGQIVNGWWEYNSNAASLRYGLDQEFNVQESVFSDLLFGVLTEKEDTLQFVWNRLPHVYLVEAGIQDGYGPILWAKPGQNDGSFKSLANYVYFDQIKIESYMNIFDSITLHCRSFKLTTTGTISLNNMWDKPSRVKIEAGDTVQIDGTIDTWGNSFAKRVTNDLWPNGHHSNIAWRAKFGAGEEELTGTLTVSTSPDDQILFWKQDTAGSLWIFGYVFERRGLHAILLKDDLSTYTNGDLLPSWDSRTPPEDISRVTLEDNPDFYFECNYIK